jgi:nicotinate dehydrogenase subunit B
MLQVAAEELDLELGQVSAVALDTAITRNQGMQVSSSSIEGTAPSLRAAAAEARQALLKLAATRLDASESDLRISAGVVSAPGRTERSITYGDFGSHERGAVLRRDGMRALLGCVPPSTLRASTIPG